MDPPHWPTTTPRFHDSLSTHQPTWLSFTITKQNEQREKVYRTESGRNQTQASVCPLPVESHRPNSSCLRKQLWQHTWKAINRGDSLEPRRAGFLSGVGQRGTVCVAPTKFQGPKRKPDVQYKPHCCYKQLRHYELHSSVLGMVKTLPKSKFPKASQEPILPAGL